MKQRLLTQLTAMLSAVTIGASLPASASESGMVFRMRESRQYLFASDLKSGDVLLDGALCIDNYSDITCMQLHLVSDSPLQIENLDFARDPSQKESDGSDKQCYFVSHGDTVVTPKNDHGEIQNKVVWYSSNSLPMTPGIVANPDSPFLVYNVLVPQGTPVGVYQAEISKDTKINEVGQKVPDFVVYNDTENLDVNCEAMRVIIEPDALRGDVDSDGQIMPTDASDTLCFATMLLAGYDLSDTSLEPFLENLIKSPYIHTGLKAADVDNSGKIEPSDASAILTYTTLKMIGLNPTWDEVIH